MKIENRLNNIFDQYDLDENRLTNALLQTLSNNENLLNVFLKKYFSVSTKKNSHIVISALKKPFVAGDIVEKKQELESMPDGWIIIDEFITIVFETKITENAIRHSQLLAHIKRCSTDKKFLCVITPDHLSPIKNIHISNADVIWLSWREIYAWITNFGKSNSGIAQYFIKQFKEYLAMKEDLVGFQGINFSTGEYDSNEAKRALKSLLREIRPEITKIYPKLRIEKKALSEHTHDYEVYHRHMWSFISAEEDFTKDIHITFWIYQTHFGMGFTVPNNAKKCWKRLKSAFKENDTFDTFIEKLMALRNNTPNLSLEFIHRHYIGRTHGVVDGLMEVDVDAIRKRSNSPVKVCPTWLTVVRNLIKDKKGFNGQFMIRTRFFYKDYPEVKSASFKNIVIKTAKRYKDIYDYLQYS